MKINISEIRKHIMLITIIGVMITIMGFLLMFDVTITKKTEKVNVPVEKEIKPIIVPVKKPVIVKEPIKVDKKKPTTKVRKKEPVVNITIINNGAITRTPVKKSVETNNNKEMATIIELNELYKELK